ncbi:hypothetical protein NC651_012749 [Populus alba x Populus x berolinensis]|nr:hypothetical protein NC651_012749 [Populus alba x Populus x berolinensis]
MRRWAGGRQRPGSGYYESCHQGVVTISLIAGDGGGKWIKPIVIFLDAFGGLWELKESVQSDLRPQVTLLIRPMQQALEVAMQHYDADMQKRSS